MPRIVFDRDTFRIVETETKAEGHNVEMSSAMLFDIVEAACGMSAPPKAEP
jgi:hypothetical protein